MTTVSRHSFRQIRPIMLISVMALLSACSTVQKRVDLNPLDSKGSKQQQFANSLQTIPGAQDASGLDPIAKAAFWGTRYDREPSNAEVAVEFSSALRAIGSNEESLKVMSQATQRIDPTADMNLELGKALIANDRAFEAVRPIEKSLQQGKNQDWHAYSAYGVALDKIGENKMAQRQYQMALDINPNAGSVLNNLGLSYALSGDLGKAENVLRQAVNGPEGTARTRQNLALVLSLAGKTKEAERLARSDLPPSMADNNADYFRALVNQPAYWQGLSSDNAELPNFDAPSGAYSAPIETVPLSQPPVPQPKAKPEPEFNPTYKEPAPKATEPSVLSQDDSLDKVLEQLATDTPSGVQAPVATGAPVPLENTAVESEPADKAEKNQRKKSGA